MSGVPHPNRKAGFWESLDVLYLFHDSPRVEQLERDLLKAERELDDAREARNAANEELREAIRERNDSRRELIEAAANRDAALGMIDTLRQTVEEKKAVVYRDLRSTIATLEGMAANFAPPLNGNTAIGVASQYGQKLSEDRAEREKQQMTIGPAIREDWAAGHVMSESQAELQAEPRVITDED